MIPTQMTPGDISTDRLWDIIERCELTETEEKQVKEYCDRQGILYLCTPFSREASDRLEAMGVPAFKIGSGECNNLPLLRHIARKGKPIILSTGMNDLDSVRRSVAEIQRLDCPLMLMHCTSMYPTPYDKVRLGAIGELRQAFDLPIGSSDHSIGIYTGLAAVALGACCVEKHFTISRSWPGPDVPLSIEPDELRELVVGSRAIFEARGGSKTVLPEEAPVIAFAFACVVALRDIAPGEVLSDQNVWVKRPGDGPIPAGDLHRVLGKTAKRALRQNDQLAPSDIDGF